MRTPSISALLPADSKSTGHGPERKDRRKTVDIPDNAIECGDNPGNTPRHASGYSPGETPPNRINRPAASGDESRDAPGHASGIDITRLISQELSGSNRRRICEIMTDEAMLQDIDRLVMALKTDHSIGKASRSMVFRLGVLCLLQVMQPKITDGR